MTDAHIDPARDHAADLIQAALAEASRRPVVKSFFDEATFTVSHVVRDPNSRACAIIDSVLDYDPASGRTSTASADALIAYVEAEDLEVRWLLETHAHADHLSAAPYLQERLGGRLAIGRDIIKVQDVFGKVFNEGTEFRRDGSQFDQLFDDGDRFAIGELQATALHVPGHTPACLAYVIGDAVFPGDTLFMPDYGTARCDFPGGDAHAMYRSIHKLYSLPDETRLFMCHDYPPAGRAPIWETTIAQQRKHNIHIRDGIDEAAYVAMREARDRTLDAPNLILPSVQVNIRAGAMPPPESNGVSYLKIPLNRI